MHRLSAFARKSIVLAAACATVGLGTSVASATKGSPQHKVTICHATASASNPYVKIKVDVASIGDTSGHGRSGVNAGDIIPAFDVAGHVYPGNNWDAAHQAIYAAGCEVNGGGSEGTTTTAADVTTTTAEEVTTTTAEISES